MLKSYFKNLIPQILKEKKLKRSSTLLPYMLGQKYFVHNGKTWADLEVVSLRLHYKAGEFFINRKVPIHKKKKRK